MKRTFCVAAVLSAMTIVPATSATAVEIDSVHVGNPGNAIDPETGWGSVDYEYYMGKYEVTNAQYVEFLNAVAVTDTHYLYNSRMWTDEYGCKIERTGSYGNCTYSVAADRADRPVNYVSWYDAARFCNWLTTGDTETGVYTFKNGSLTGILDHETAAATLGSTPWFIPTDDEWYKAAYHKNDGATGNYFGYPTSSDAIPSNDLIDPDPGNNTNSNQDGYTIGGLYYTTVVGEFENSESPYGTFDQGGNLFEWTEMPIGPVRRMRGSFWGDKPSITHASQSSAGLATDEPYITGFRVASIPEPGSITLLLSAVVMSSLARRRRS